MAFNKGDKADASKVRRGGMRRRKKFAFSVERRTEQSITRIQTSQRDTYLREVKFFLEESQETVQSTRELLQ